MKINPPEKIEGRFMLDRITDEGEEPVWYKIDAVVPADLAALLYKEAAEYAGIDPTKEAQNV